MQSQESGPGRKGYVLAGIVFLVGVAGAVALAAVFFLGLIGLGGDLERVVGPGATEVELTESGRYVIFYEYESEFDGVRYSTSSTPPDMNISLQHIDSGEEIRVDRTRGETSYDLLNHAGESIREFRIDQPGSYEMSVEYADGRDSPEFVLAYGEGIGRGILTSVGAFFGGGILFCFMTLAAISIAGITFYRRYQAGRPQET